MLIRNPSTIASCFDMPSLMLWIMLTRIWIESAIASVRIIVGAVEDGPVILSPTQPAKPIPIIAENKITNTETNVAVNDLNIRPITTIIIRDIIGVSVPMSLIED